MKKSILKKMKKQAMNGAKNAYSPYSNIKVGASVLTKDGQYFFGGNVENISYGGTICAERAAICRAITEGHREFQALYLYTKEQWAPCGICLQFMSEFLNPETPVILGSDNKEDIFLFKDLLPKLADKKTFYKLQK